MAESALTAKPHIDERNQASRSGPRAYKQKGSPEWCWQTVNALDSVWQQMEFTREKWDVLLSELQETEAWKAIPEDQPYGTLDALLHQELGATGSDIEDKTLATQLRVTRANRIPKKQKTNYGSADYLTLRIARARPDILERIKAGEYQSIRAAAIDAGIVKKQSKRVHIPLDPGRAARLIHKHFGPEGAKQIAMLLRTE